MGQQAHLAALAVADPFCPAPIEFDDRDKLLVGRLLGIRDRVSFHADNVAELRAAFEEAVDDYIETCTKIGKTAEKPASGKLMLRIPPEVHGAALVAAQAAGDPESEVITVVGVPDAGMAGMNVLLVG